MTDEGKRWKNIFYFIAYCENKLKYIKPDGIDFDNVSGFWDLLTYMMNKYFNRVYKLGLNRCYVQNKVTTSHIKGKVDYVRTYSTGAIAKGMAVCNVEELSIDTESNRMVKLAYNLLLQQSKRIDSDNVKIATRNFNRLRNVSNVEPSTKLLQAYFTIPAYYESLLAISKFIIRHWVLLDKDGKNRLYTLKDKDQAEYIWEEFLRNYIADYLYSVDKQFKVEKRKYLSGAIGNKKFYYDPDVKVTHRNLDIPTLVMDAKWYEEAEMTKDIYAQMNTYAYEAKNLSPEGKTVKAAVVFGYNKDYESKKADLRAGQRFTLQQYIINVNQDFEDIKSDIRMMVDEQLNL